MIVSKHSRGIYKLQLYPTLKEETLLVKYHKLVLIFCKRSGPFMYYVITSWPVFILLRNQFSTSLLCQNHLEFPSADYVIICERLLT